MKSWEELTKASLLGTERSNPQEIALPEPIAKLLDSKNTSKELQLIQRAALLMNYKRCGWEYPVEPLPAMQAAPVEILPICSHQSGDLLKRVFEINESSLLELWLKSASAKGQIAPAHLLPALLN